MPYAHGDGPVKQIKGRSGPGLNDMKIRLTDVCHSDDVLLFSGIRGQDKIRAFLMADILTYSAYRRFSTLYISRSDSKNEATISKIASSVKYLVKDYSGFTSGTPADQISKRVDNMVRLLRGMKQETVEDKPAISINEKNLDYYRNVCNKKTDMPQPSVEVRLSSGRFKEEYGTHVPFSALIDWISFEIIDGSSDDPSLLVIHKLVNDISRRVREHTNLTEQDLLTEMVDLFLSLSCIFSNDLDSIGETSEFTFDDSSLSVLFPSFNKPSVGNGLLVINDNDTELDIDSIKAKCGIETVETIGKCIHPFEMEMNCYRSNTVLGDSYGVVITTENHETLDMYYDIASKMDWFPETTIVITDTITPAQMLDGVIRIDVDNCSEDVILKINTGICHSDRYAAAILRTVFKDLFLTVYKDSVDIFVPTDPIMIIDSIRQHIKANPVPLKGKHSELLLALLSSIE